MCASALFWATRHTCHLCNVSTGSHSPGYSRPEISGRLDEDVDGCTGNRDCGRGLVFDALYPDDFLESASTVPSSIAHLFYPL